MMRELTMVTLWKTSWEFHQKLQRKGLEGRTGWHLQGLGGSEPLSFLPWKHSLSDQ